jgi:hypothetical protein
MAGLPLEALSRTEETVTFGVTQTWKIDDETEIAWLATHFVENGVVICDKEESVPFDTTLTYSADCDASGYAEIDVYIYDPKFDTNLDEAAPPIKCGTFEVGQQCQYKKRFACGCGGGEGAVSATPSASPTFLAPRQVSLAYCPAVHPALFRQ